MARSVDDWQSDVRRRPLNRGVSTIGFVAGTEAGGEDGRLCEGRRLFVELRQRLRGALRSACYGAAYELGPSFAR